MKTMNFGTLKVSPGADGDAILYVKVPGQGEVSLYMTADEVMLFLVEVGNGLASARQVELAKKIQRDLLKEKRR